MIVRQGPITLPANAALAPYLRVKLSGGYLAAADATEDDIGTLSSRVLSTDTKGTVVLKNQGGTRKMVAAGAFSAHALVYGASGGKIDDVANENFVGIALQAASGAGSIVEVLTQVKADTIDNLGSIAGNIVFDDDFVGDHPAAATAMTANRWTKVETNALGVISSDEPNGVLKFSADAVAEAATCALYMINAPIDIDKTPIVEFILGVFDIGDDAALDINFGLADDTHATDFDALTKYIAFHLDGNSLILKAQSTDGVTTVAAVTTGLTLVDNQYAKFKIDATDKADVKLYVSLTTTGDYARVLSGTTFDISALTGALTPIVHVEKTSNDTTFDVRLDRVRFQCGRN